MFKDCFTKSLSKRIPALMSDVYELLFLASECCRVACQQIEQLFLQHLKKHRPNITSGNSLAAESRWEFGTSTRNVSGNIGDSCIPILYSYTDMLLSTCHIQSVLEMLLLMGDHL